jgi:hypothetical protein
MTVKEGEKFCGQHMIFDSSMDCNKSVSWNANIPVKFVSGSFSIYIR